MHALGGGFEPALMADIAVVARDTRIGMLRPASWGPRSARCPWSSTAQAYQGEAVAGYLFHAYGTNLRFEDDEFNVVKARAKYGTKRAFQLRDEHFEIPEP